MPESYNITHKDSLKGLGNRKKEVKKSNWKISKVSLRKTRMSYKLPTVTPRI